MKTFQSKKTFIFLLLFSFLFNFLPLGAESNFKPPVLNSTDPVFNGPVTAIVRDEMTGIVYVGGGFTSVGKNTGSGVPVDILTGRTQSTFPKINGRVFAVISDNSGGWYIGGDFTSVGGIIRNHLAHVLSDGTLDLKWDPDANNTVAALAIKDSTIYVGGDFNKIGGRKRNHLAAIDTDGALLEWDPNIRGKFSIAGRHLGATVQTLAIKDSIIYIGGRFEKVKGAKRNNLAAIGTDGTLKNWNPNASGGIFKGVVKALSISDSMIYIGGNFNKIEGKKRNNLAAIGINGVIQDWNPGANNTVYALAIKDSTIYVGGSFGKIGGTITKVEGGFTTVGGIERNNLAAIGTDGVLKDWNPHVLGTGVYALTISDSNVYIGGHFRETGGTKRTNLAAIGIDGALLDWNPNAFDIVDAIAVNGSTVYVGGAFNSIAGAERNRLAAIGTDGTLLNWNPSADSTVYALAIKDSTIYVGGIFDKIGEVERNNLAAIGTDGVLKDWNPGADSTIHALVIKDSTIYVGGSFSKIGDVERTGLAAIGTDGTLLDWNPNVSEKTSQLEAEDFPRASVTALVLDGSTIYVGGAFNKIGDVERTGLAAIRTDGTLLDWNPNVKTDYTNLGGILFSPINALAISGSTIYIGGTFTSVGEEKRNSLAAIGVDGSLLEWDPNKELGYQFTESDYAVKSLAISDSIIYVGGWFYIPKADDLAAIDTNGTVLEWNTNIKGRPSYVNVLLASDSTLYVGGETGFASFNIPDGSK